MSLFINKCSCAATDSNCACTSARVVAKACGTNECTASPRDAGTNAAHATHPLRHPPTCEGVAAIIETPAAAATVEDDTLVFVDVDVCTMAGLTAVADELTTDNTGDGTCSCFQSHVTYSQNVVK
jgi:hypothetical protein